MRRDKPDGKAAAIYETLRAAGWQVRRIARGVDREAGLPDAMVARRPAKHAHLLEIKELGRHLSKAQIDFAMTWPSCVHCAHSSFEAEALLEECEKRLDVGR